MSLTQSAMVARPLRLHPAGREGQGGLEQGIDREPGAGRQRFEWKSVV